MVLLAAKDYSFTGFFDFLDGSISTYLSPPPTGWTFSTSSNRLTVSYNHNIGGQLGYAAYIYISARTFVNAPTIFIYTGTNLFIQSISVNKNFTPVPPYKFEMVATYSIAGFPVDISIGSPNSGWYTPGNVPVNVTISNNTDPVNIATGLGFGSNLSQSFLPKGTITTTTHNPQGLLLFIAKGPSDSGTGYFNFKVGGYPVLFPINLTGTSSRWLIGYVNGPFQNCGHVLSIAINDPTPINFLSIQINIDSINSFEFDVNRTSSSAANPNFGLQGMQFSTASPIPVCLITDCAVWTSQGLEKIQDLKSGCQLVAVDIEGQEFLAKFNVFVQTPRDGQVDICRHEEDVIVSDHHTILYPNSEIKDNFICPRCLIDKPYTNEIGITSCHHCHIFNIKNHTPVLSMESWLPIEKADTTLYHVIPEDLINVKGFKVGKRRVLISEITTSEIQLLMSGFVKV